MDLNAWRREALRHCLWLVSMAGPEYAMHAADRAERESNGALSGLSARVRQAIEKHAAKRKEPGDATR